MINTTYSNISFFSALHHFDKLNKKLTEQGSIFSIWYQLNHFILQRLTSSPTNSSIRWQFNDTSNNRTFEARPFDSNLQNGSSSNSARTLARLSNIERKTRERWTTPDPFSVCNRVKYKYARSCAELRLIPANGATLTA